MIGPPSKPPATLPSATLGCLISLVALLSASAGCSAGGDWPGLGGGSSEGAAGSGGDHADHSPYAGVAFPNRRPPVVVPAGGLGIVTDSFSDKLSLVAPATGERTGVVPVGVDPITVDGPLDAAAGGDGWLYVLLTYPEAPSSAKGPHAIHATYDPPGYVQKLSLSDLSIAGQVQIDVEPRDLAVSEDGARVVALHPFEDQIENALLDPENLDWYRGRLAVIDPEAVAPILSDDPVRVRPCLVPRSVVLSRPSGAIAFVACYGEDAIAIVDLASEPAKVERIAVADDAGTPGSPKYGPSVVALSPDGETLAFASVLTREIGFLSVADKAVGGGQKETAGTPVALTYSADGGSLFAVTVEPAAVVRFGGGAGGGEETAARPLGEVGCEAPSAVSVSPDGSLAVVCAGDGLTPGRVLFLNPSTLDTVYSTEVGLRPTSVTFVKGAGP